MTQLVSFPLQEGGSVVVEVSDRLGSEPGVPESSERIRGRGRPRFEGTVLEAGETLESAIGRIEPAARAIVKQLISGIDPPEVVEVSFGIQLSGKFGAVFAEAAGQANLAVKLTWRGGDDPRVS